MTRLFSNHAAPAQPLEGSELSLDDLSQVNGGVALVVGRIAQGVAPVSGRLEAVFDFIPRPSRIYPGGRGVVVNPF